MVFFGWFSPRSLLALFLALFCFACGNPEGESPRQLLNLNTEASDDDLETESQNISSNSTPEPTGFDLILEQEPFAFWKLTEESGDQAKDSVEDNDGTFTSKPERLTDGLFETYLSPLFRNYAVSVDHRDEFNNFEALTMSGFFRRDLSADTSDFLPLVSKMGADDTRRGFLIGIAPDGTVACWFIQNAAKGKFVKMTSPQAYQDARRHHFACSYDGNRASLYIDGNRVDTKTWNKTLPKNFEPVRIGLDIQKNRFFAGYIGAVGLFDYALTAVEIQQQIDAFEEN